MNFSSTLYFLINLTINSVLFDPRPEDIQTNKNIDYHHCLTTTEVY